MNCVLIQKKDVDTETDAHRQEAMRGHTVELERCIYKQEAPEASRS